jgi:hypothetical protein
MSFAIYILRKPAQTIVPALYSPDDTRAATVGIEQATSIALPSQPAEILKPDLQNRFKTGERLTYKEFLAVIMEAEKVITL